MFKVDCKLNVVKFLIDGPVGPKTTFWPVIIILEMEFLVRKNDGLVCGYWLAMMGRGSPMTNNFSI